MIRTFAVLANRDLRLLWLSRAVSSFGAWLVVVAIPAHVFAQTGSTTATGLVVAAQYLPPVLLGPLAGSLADRLDRRHVMVASDLLRAAAIAVLLLSDEFWLVYPVMAVESAGTVLFRPAAQAHIPTITGTGPTLAAANSLTALTDGAMRLLGPPLGAALLFTAGYHTLIAADAISYLISAALIARTTRHPRVTPTRTQLSAGAVFLRDNPAPRALVLSLTLFFAGNAALSALVVPFAVIELGGELQAGLVMSALGAGSLLGAPAVTPLMDRFAAHLLLSAALLGIAIGFVLLFSAPTLTPALLAATLIGIAGVLALTSAQTALQRATPTTLLGRVTAVLLMAEAAATLSGSVIGPIIAGAPGSSTLITAWAAAALTALGAAVALRGNRYA
ncbi:MFS transporter [Actinosynnema pretiosum subsp. pretiosum]|uniref:Major facilitator superfamily MFS_1 n=2 Tax=Actinosynnema TaxID=40566 RepID=C6WJL7_ACTMD|nr:MFS transporter [Actinosynnema mirum]ACU36242.1 major facilitator superfamily MFS_1 [Actinosynnema mirum DSM 43827]AXX29695.1 transporter, putative [Actinosynnema pretiosum subsp. pretiosum]QUF06081.1 MFS transporter [Actinosynnema pretiosum subsp. pretiosum]